MIPLTTEELTKKVIELDERTIRHGEQINNCANQIENLQSLTSSVYKLATSVEVLTNAQKSTEVKVDSLHKDVEAIKEKPAKNWESMVRLIFEIILAAIVGWVLVQTGLK